MAQKTSCSRPHIIERQFATRPCNAIMERDEWAPLSLYKRVTNAQSCIQNHKKQWSQKILKMAVQRPLRAWTSLWLRKGGGGGGYTCCLRAVLAFLHWIFVGSD